MRIFWRNGELSKGGRKVFLSDLHRGDRGKIIAIHANKTLKDRLISFGLMPQEEIAVVTCSVARQTMQIAIGSANIALRIDEARKIEVEKIESSRV